MRPSRFSLACHPWCRTSYRGRLFPGDSFESDDTVLGSSAPLKFSTSTVTFLCLILTFVTFPPVSVTSGASVLWISTVAVLVAIPEPVTASPSVLSDVYNPSDLIGIETVALAWPSAKVTAVVEN